MQIIKQGGETNLHSHAHLDGFWYVLRGRGRFYSDETTFACEVGPNEGVLIPRGTKYWFESVGDELLEMIQVECSDKSMRSNKELMADRNDFTPRTREFTVGLNE